jgi:hypothetical protein
MSKLAILALLVCAASATAGHWDIEKVDSAGWGASVDMRWHPDGRLFLCYTDTSGIIRLASKDTIWSYEDLPQWRTVVSGTQGFDIDRSGRIGASYVGTDGHCWCALKTDTVWADVPTPFFGHPFFPSLIALDPAGSIAIAVQEGDAFKLARQQDTEWVTQTLATGYSGFTNYFDCSALGSASDDLIWGVFRYGFSFPGKALVYGDALYRFHARDSDVNVVQIAGGAECAIWTASGCSDTQGSVHACYHYYHPFDPVGLYLDQTAIDTITVEQTSVRFDSLDRPQIAYARPELYYTYSDITGWHNQVVDERSVLALDMLLSDSCQPIIAYATDSGVFVARGEDVTGQTEERLRPTAFGSRLTATVVRKVLRIPDSPFTSRSSLFDMAGRRVTDLRPGANDVSGLAPGVYFVRLNTAVSCQQSGRAAVRKVIVP